MRQAKYAIGIIVLTIILSIGSTPSAKAVDASLNQRINGVDNCDIDQVYSGLGIHYTILPERCSDHLPNPAQLLPNSADGQQSFTNVGSSIDEIAAASTQNGDQGSFENTIVEPMAAWLGIGNPEASPANPVIATATLGTGTGLAIDAALFESQYRQRLFAAVRRLIRALLRLG